MNLPIAIAFAIAYIAVATLWFTKMLDESMTAGVIIILIFISVVQVITTGITLQKHQKVLEWFANHIHMNADALDDEFPVELKDLVRKEDDTTPSDKP